MTPQLSQSIKLLTMSNIELSTFVEDEIERNPFLERDTRPDGDAQENRTSDAASNGESAETIRDVTALTELETSAQSLSENLGTSVENEFPDEQDYFKADKQKETSSGADGTHLTSSGLSVSSNTSAYDKTVADFAASSVSLQDHLAAQLSMAAVSAPIAAISSELISNLDDAGYLVESIADISERLGAESEDVEEALKLVQSFEPTGVGARSLSECLSLQLRENDHLDPAMQIILDNLDVLAKRDFASLSRLAGINTEDLQDALIEIQALDPKPGTAFESAPLQHIAPDVFVTEATDGSWKIELNSETLPRVLINESYSAKVSSQLGKDAEKEFITDCMQTANWLTKSLDQRAKTILKVATEITKQQDAFLAEGIRHLKPLTLNEVAIAIDMHESTVSRVTSNKYVMTPRGLYELKFFFTTSIGSTEGGEGHSSAAVRDRIREMIDAETADNILSDDTIVTNLKDDGIDIARRTVAKYRDAMHIQSSVQRRREKRAARQLAS